MNVSTVARPQRDAGLPLAPRNDRTTTAGRDLSSRDYRQALGRFATGVAIVATVTSHGHVGMTINSFGSLSLEPRLIGWSLARTSHGCEAFTSCRDFSINILAANQLAIARRFATRGADKFQQGFEFDAADSGAPRLRGSLATFLCRTYNIVDAGDHLLILGKVESFQWSAGAPLIFSDGNFCRDPQTLNE